MGRVAGIIGGVGPESTIEYERDVMSTDDPEESPDAKHSDPTKASAALSSPTCF